MKKILYFSCFILIVISLIWGFTQDGWYEPWTASIAAFIGFISLFVNDSQGDQKQSNVLSAFNSSKIKGRAGKVRQFNLFGWGNTQEIDNSEEE